MSPTGLKQLRLIRRRLVAAHTSSSLTATPERLVSVTEAGPGAEAAYPGGSTSSRSKRRNAKALQVAALHLVGPAWVTDSLAELAQQQQQQQDYEQQHHQQQPHQQRGAGHRQGRQAVVKRRSEWLYEPAVLVQQQQQQQDDEQGDGRPPGVTAVTAEGPVPAADVRRWPWQDVGLTAGGGGDSSESGGELCLLTPIPLSQHWIADHVRGNAGAAGAAQLACCLRNESETYQMMMRLRNLLHVTYDNVAVWPAA